MLLHLYWCAGPKYQLWVCVCGGEQSSQSLRTLNKMQRSSVVEEKNQNKANSLDCVTIFRYLLFFLPLFTAKLLKLKIYTNSLNLLTISILINPF